MTVLMTLNQWANRCGHFFNCNLTEGMEDKPNVNNGYNCNHPDCGDEEDGIGCCRADTCPLAFSADGTICSNAGIDCESCGNEECECYDDMMVVEINEEDYDDRYMYRLKEDS